ncbi:ExeA family protein [Bythopirellula polymerisocia]|uniref:ORC1/DEAH AAA+ ATPase domain-containing protein n=1 Tax=Bythopirellula polymerisocia TaxID=2528003 RepID=A0A5C6CZM0_9BACT|nr:AAA family ATPase [Bythopirellula polymerisocia]TWU30040.1 hypothetical protein Pla144_08260 [Bythopirellula polymerisocia]
MQAWRLEKLPFSTGHAETVFFAGLPQQEALARMRFLVHNGLRLGLVLGQSGGGKSMLLELFDQERQSENWSVARLNLLGMSVREFHWQLALGLRACPRAGDEPLRLERRWQERLRQNRLQDERVVLLLDDVDQAGADMFTQLVRLVQLPPEQVGNLTIVLSANTDERHRLGKRLMELVDLRIDLEPWEEADTVGYLQLALVEAGAEQPVFDEAALAEIHRLSGGVPRQVNRLADFALVAKGEAETINKATVAEVHASLTSRV